MIDEKDDEMIVTTFDGKKIKKKDSVWLNSQKKYYEKEVSAFQVDQTPSGRPQWYRFDHPHIAFDESSQTYVDDRVAKLKRILKGWNSTDFATTFQMDDAVWGKTTGNHPKWYRTGEFILNMDLIVDRLVRELKCTKKEAQEKIFFDDKNNIYHDYTSDQIVEDCNIPGAIVLKTRAEKVLIEIGKRGGTTFGWTRDAERGIRIASDKYDYKWVANEDLAEQLGLKEDIYDGIYKDRPSGKVGKKRYYEFTHDPEKLQVNIAKSANVIAEGLPYTFGIEIETSAGLIPPRIMVKYPFKAIRDGSIPETGAEYISDVLGGDYGFQMLEGFCTELTRRCKVNEQCSTHVHIGKVPCTPEFNVAIYSLCEKIQDEIFSMLPYSRIDHKYNEKYHIKKNYCKPLKRLFYKPTVTKLLDAIDNKDYKTYDSVMESLDDKVNEHVLSYLEGEQEMPPPKDWKTKFNRETKRHFMTNKYHRAQRYEWLSLVSYNFDPGCHIEARCHSGTVSYRKISNWVKICMAIAWYAQNKLRECLDPHFIPTLQEIVDFAYPRSGNSLNSYIAERKEKFNKDVETMEDRARVEEEEYAKNE